MKKYFLLCIITTLSWGHLVPTPLLTDPYPIQRFSADVTMDLAETQLFGQCYGISMVKIRDVDPDEWLCVMSDPVLDYLVYIVGVDSVGERYSRFVKSFDDWLNPQYFGNPRGLACDSTVYNSTTTKYYIYIADCDNDRIVRTYYDVSGDTMYFYDYMLDQNQLSGPEDVFCLSTPDGAAYLLIADTDSHRIHIVKINSNLTYSTLKIYGSYGSSDGQFNTPISLSMVPCEDSLNYYRIYVVDQNNYRIVSLLYDVSLNAISWERTFTDYTKESQFCSVIANPYYCVYVTDIMRSRITVFKPGLIEVLYTYGAFGYSESQFINPKDICIYQDEIAVTELWANNTGVQYFRIIPEVRDFCSEPEAFDATEDSVELNFKVCETKHYLTMIIPDAVTLFDNQEFEPGSYSVYWNGRDNSGLVVLPGCYEIKIFCGEHCIGTTSVTVKGTQVSGVLSENEHWTEEGEPYVLTGDVQIASNGRLTIDPGVKVMPAGNYMIKLPAATYRNSIIAQGSPTDKILFTPHRKLYPEPDSVAKGFWKGIDFRGRADDSLILKHCGIEAASSENYLLIERDIWI